MKVKDAVLSKLIDNKNCFFSGEELATSLGVSRNSVWKAIKALQLEGYQINAVTNKGYMLSDLPTSLNAGVIMSLLSNTPDNFTIDVKESVTSTNTILKESASQYVNHDHLLIANEQTAGRGRMGRNFHSPSSSGIYMSLILHPDFSASESLYLTTGIATAAARAIEEVCKVETKIKWVNDIFVNDRKICGILTEAAMNFEAGTLDYVIVGIGINIEEPKGGFPDEIKEVAGAIYKHGTSPDDIKNKLTASILNYFYEYYYSIKDKTFLEEYKRRSCIIGKKIKIIDNIFDPGSSINATALDIDNECHLIVELEDGTKKTLSSGDVSIRRM